ncbi:50S ribosomal protein L19 [Elusimicrobiota bacterium]
MRSFNDIAVGDTIKVIFKTREEGSERTQTFMGVLIKVRGQGPSQTFTARKVSFGTGVERIFPVQSPNIVSIKVLKKGNVRRSKLYYLRNLKAKDQRAALA